MANVSAIEKAIQDVVFNDLEESFIPCKDKSVQESVRVMTYTARGKLAREYKDTIAVTKIEEDGMLFVKVYKRAFVETWIRDKVTGKLVPSREKILSPEEVKEQEYKLNALYEKKEKEVSAVVETIDLKSHLVSPELYKEEEPESWAAKEVNVRKSEKDLMKEMMKGE